MSLLSGIIKDVTNSVKWELQSEARRAVKKGTTAAVNKVSGVVKENIALFNREIELLGTKPVLIAFGDKTYRILDAYLSGEYKIVKVKHYSYTIGKEDYRREMLKALEGL